MVFRDHFSTQANRYQRFRPKYPDSLFEHLARLPSRPGVAWDCGTGSGQAATELANYFDLVVATDPSLRQLTHAHGRPGVAYALGTAEQPPLADASVDLVTVAQAVHWFDRPAFYREAHRVGRPGSVMAIWSYALATITPAVDTVVWRLYEEILGDYWPPERKLVENRYQDIEWPFAEIEVPAYTMTARWSLDELCGYLGTWSSSERYLAQHGTDPRVLVNTDLHRAWGAAKTRREVRWPLVIRVARLRAE